MIEEMPFTLARNNKPYILEAMEIYATEKLKNHGVSHHVSDSSCSCDEPIREVIEVEVCGNCDKYYYR